MTQEDKRIAIILPNWNSNEPRFIVEDAHDGLADDRAFKNGKCVYNQRLGIVYTVEYIVDALNELADKVDEQQATITSLKDENLYNNFKLKSVDDLKKLKDIFEICMILIDGAITDEDLELGYESVFQFERRIKKFNGDLNE